VKYRKKYKIIFHEGNYFRRFLFLDGFFLRTLVFPFMMQQFKKFGLVVPNVELILAREGGGRRERRGRQRMGYEGEKGEGEGHPCHQGE
jgi:hypothetical protein